MRYRGLSRHAVRKDRKCCLLLSITSLHQQVHSKHKPDYCQLSTTPSPALTCMSQQAKRAISTWREENPICLHRLALLDRLLLKSHQLLPISSPPAAVSRVFTVVCVSRPKTNQPGNSGQGGFAFLRAGLGKSFLTSALHIASKRKCIMPSHMSGVWWETRSPTGRKAWHVMAGTFLGCNVGVGWL